MLLFLLKACFYEHLTWKCHINKIYQCMGILNRLKRFLPIHTKLLIYNSLVLSHLNFGILLWGFKYGKVFKLQKKVVRILSLSKYNAHTEPIFKKIKLLKIRDILKLQELKFYYKYKKKNCHITCNLYHLTPIQKLIIIQLAYNMIYINPLVNMFSEKTVFALTYPWLLITVLILY